MNSIYQDYLLTMFKGLVHPKMKIKSLITHPHAVPTRKTFVRLRNTNEDIFD